MDPEFAVAASELSTDTEKALAKYQKTRPDLIAAMKEFTKLFAGHVTAKADEEEKAAMPKLDPKEQEMVDRVLNDERVVAAMRDPKVQEILTLAKSGHHTELFKILSQDKALQAKINILKETGLLRFES
jgi:hypothetical protein